MPRHGQARDVLVERIQIDLTRSARRRAGGNDIDVGVTGGSDPTLVGLHRDCITFADRDGYRRPEMRPGSAFAERQGSQCPAAGQLGEQAGRPDGGCCSDRHRCRGVHQIDHRRRTARRRQLDHHIDEFGRACPLTPRLDRQDQPQQAASSQLRHRFAGERPLRVHPLRVFSGHPDHICYLLADRHRRSFNSVGFIESGSSELLGASGCDHGWHRPSSAGAGPAYPSVLVVTVTKCERDPPHVLDDPVGAFAAGIGRAGVDGGDVRLLPSVDCGCQGIDLGPLPAEAKVWNWSSAAHLVEHLSLLLVGESVDAARTSRVPSARAALQRPELVALDY